MNQLAKALELELATAFYAQLPDEWKCKGRGHSDKTDRAQTMTPLGHGHCLFHLAQRAVLLCKKDTIDPSTVRFHVHFRPGMGYHASMRY